MSYATIAELREAVRPYVKDVDSLSAKTPCKVPKGVRMPTGIYGEDFKLEKFSNIRGENPKDSDSNSDDDIPPLEENPSDNEEGKITRDFGVEDPFSEEVPKEDYLEIENPVKENNRNLFEETKQNFTEIKQKTIYYINNISVYKINIKNIVQENPTATAIVVIACGSLVGYAISCMM